MNTDELCMKLKKIPFFASLQDEVIRQLCQVSTSHTYHKDDIVYEEGDSADAFYIILRGEGFALKMINREKGEYKSLGIISTGDIMGGTGLDEKATRFVTLKAKDDMEVLKISKQDMARFFEKERESALSFFLQMLSQLMATVSSLTREQIALYETGKLIASGKKEDEFIREIVPIIKGGVPSADSGFIALYNPFIEEFEIRHGRDITGKPFEKSSFSKTEPLPTVLIETRQFYEGNPSKDHSLWGAHFPGAQAGLCYPILSGDSLLGFIALASHEKAAVFPPEQKNFLIGICNMIAPALEAAGMRREAERRELLERHIY
jgi:CRP/FNR family transcriptional regulator, cyclic AMP receptor protein